MMICETGFLHTHSAISVFFLGRILRHELVWLRIMGWDHKELAVYTTVVFFWTPRVGRIHTDTTHTIHTTHSGSLCCDFLSFVVHLRGPPSKTEWGRERLRNDMGRDWEFS